MAYIISSCHNITKLFGAAPQKDVLQIYSIEFYPISKSFSSQNMITICDRLLKLSEHQHCVRLQNKGSNYRLQTNVNVFLNDKHEPFHTCSTPEYIAFLFTFEMIWVIGSKWTFLHLNWPDRLSITLKQVWSCFLCATLNLLFHTVKPCSCCRALRKISSQVQQGCLPDLSVKTNKGIIQG